jgi:hypothetical protein
MYYKIITVIYFLHNSSSALLTVLIYIVLLSYGFEVLEFITKVGRQVVYRVDNYRSTSIKGYVI